MTNSSSLHQRRRKSPTSGNSNATSLPENNDARKSPPISFSDILRVLTTLLALSVSLSYYLTSGDSFTFNHRPWFTRYDRLKAYIRGPLLLTPTQLLLYNGTSYPTLPIYLALNATIFDVSASPHTYGPGGSYHMFAGRDATRAFVTGCFSEDLTGDLRGVERMYVPVEDVEGAEEGLAGGERKIRAEREVREARGRVRAEVERWVGFYGGSGKYFEVGRVVAEEGEGEVPELCEAAEKARPRRSQLIAAEKAGKGKGKSVFKPKAGGKPV